MHLLIEDDEHKISLYRLKMDGEFMKIRTKIIKSTYDTGVNISLKELLERILFNSAWYRALASYTSERIHDNLVGMKLYNVYDSSTEDKDITWYHPARYELYLSPSADENRSEIDIKTFKIDELRSVGIHLKAFMFILSSVYIELKDNGELDNITF